MGQRFGEYFRVTAANIQAAQPIWQALIPQQGKENELHARALQRIQVSLVIKVKSFIQRHAQAIARSFGKPKRLCFRQSRQRLEACGARSGQGALPFVLVRGAPIEVLAHDVALGIGQLEGDEVDGRDVVGDINSQYVVSYAVGWDVDLVLTHTCPMRMIPTEAMMPGVNQSTVDQSTERWLEIAGITIQPSEVLKFVTIMVIAAYMQKNYDKMHSFVQGFIPLMIRVGIACLLVVIQPHLSATLIILTISVAMIFIGGAKTTHVLLVLAGIAVAGYLVIEIFPKIGFDYVSDRMLSFRDPEADIRKATYQTYQSLIAIGSGGMFGQGLGNSHQKYSYLPFVSNDFIFSIIVEELGFVGAAVVVLLFLILIIRGFYIATSAPDKFGMLLCAGIVIQIGVQALLNIAVVSNAFPNTGVSLPFISYGGTALMMQLAEMGIVLNISRKASI